MAYLIVYYTVTYCNTIVHTSKITKDFIDKFVETHNGCKIVNIIKLEDWGMVKLKDEFSNRLWIEIRKIEFED